MNICYCSGTYGERIPQTIEGVKRIKGHVDRMIIIADESVTETQKRKLKALGCEVYVHPWEDSMVRMRNSYIKKCLTGDFIIVADPDEWFGEEFCKDIRKIIARAEKEGYGLLLISSHDITNWENGKTTKHVSGFMKNLIFKKTPETKYVGVGTVKEVHENLSLAPDTKILRLDPKYFYEHHKHEHEIWERAARNVFIAGGGDNVGELNTAWKPLRQICAGLGLEKWPQARAYLRKGNIDPILKQWIINHRFEGYNFEHEMMEFFIWYKWMHPEELEGFEPVKNVKEARISEIKEYISVVGKEVLGTEISEVDKTGLTANIKGGGMEQKDLRGLLEGYRREVIQKPPETVTREGERVRLPVPVDVDVRITDDAFILALKKSRTLWGKIKPRIDIGKFVESQVWDKLAFHIWFYQNRDEVGFEELRAYVESHGFGTVALCIMGYHDVVPMILESIDLCKDYTDEIHIQGDDFTEKDIRDLKNHGQKVVEMGLVPICQVHIEPWREDFSDYKNKAISHANTQWVLICDHDEIPTPELVGHLLEIIAESEKGEKYNIVQFECIDVTVDEKGKVIKEEPMGPRKQLLHVNIKDPYYGNPHIWLKPDYYKWSSISVPYAYKHIKAEGDEMVRAVRNVFLGGGGDNWREKNDLWVELRKITDKLKIFTWKDFHAYLKKGNVDVRLKDLFERMYKKAWHDDELRAFKEYYYKLHPKEVKK